MKLIRVVGDFFASSGSFGGKQIFSLHLATIAHNRELSVDNVIGEHPKFLTDLYILAKSSCAVLQCGKYMHDAIQSKHSRALSKSCEGKSERVAVTTEICI